MSHDDSRKRRRESSDAVSSRSPNSKKLASSSPTDTDDKFVIRRFNCFRTVYPDEHLELKLDDKLFGLSSSSLSVDEEDRYEKYVEALIELEKKWREREARRAEQEAATRLGGILSDKDLKKFLDNVPANFFTENPLFGDCKCTLDYLKTNEVTFGKRDIEEVVKRLYNNNPSLDKVPDMVVSATDLEINKDILTYQGDVLTEFFPFPTILVRECYLTAFDRIKTHGDLRNVLVVGDPGVGKTTMLRYAYYRLREDGENVFWAMESGQWNYGEGSTGSTSNGHVEPAEDGVPLMTTLTKGRYESGLAWQDRNEWRRDDVWLLIDGSADDRFLAKIRRAVIFSSPEKRNYHKMIKATKGTTLVIPPWNWEEVEKLFQIKIGEECLGYTLMKAYVKNLRLQVTEQDEENSDCDVEGGGGVDEGGERFTEFKFYDERAAMADLVQKGVDKNGEKLTEFIKREIEYRFRLIGGRPRLLFNPSVTYTRLFDEVRKAVFSVTLEHLSQEFAFDMHSYIPSILYSLHPPQYELDNHRIAFASRHIQRMITSRLVATKRKRTELAEAFTDLADAKVANSLLGKVFESVVHNIIGRGGMSLKGRSLTPPESQASYTLNLPSAPEVKSFTSIESLPQLVAAGKEKQPMYLIPESSTQPQVDGILFISETCKVLLQMTVCISPHSFILHNEIDYIQQLREKLGWRMDEVEFVFVVPQGVEGCFKEQRQLMMKRPPLKQLSGMKQYVVGIGENRF
ncbi:hypothetical protein HK102_003383 [Quaeritorhiza haematococci]|nr:hypothetical protein HK102_003383 [Quaeritorhiza haematococci]